MWCSILQALDLVVVSETKKAENMAQCGSCGVPGSLKMSVRSPEYPQRILLVSAFHPVFPRGVRLISGPQSSTAGLERV